MSLNFQPCPITVTQPASPPLEEFIPYLEQIWASRKLTNAGPFHAQLEQALCEHLGVSHLALFANGTLALVSALQALRITGEVITTPYSFVATSHALLWNGLKPVFVDIDPVTLNLDLEKIEAAISPHTSAILPMYADLAHEQAEAIAELIAQQVSLNPCGDAAHPSDGFVNQEE
jgi:dTDP-4-amino-4,6-dideoxygalactose transaminase